MKIIKTKLFTATIFSTFIFFLASCSHEGNTSLKLNLNKGDKYSYLINTETKSNQEMMGKKMDSNQKIGMTYGMEVTDKDANGNMTMHCVFNRIQMKQNNSVKGGTDFDSDDSTAEVSGVNKMFQALKGADFEFIMSPAGEIKNMKGLDKLFDRMFASMPESVGAMGSQMKDMMKQYFGEDAMKESFSSFRIYPDHAVSVGDEWKNEAGMAMMGLTMKNNYKLKEVTGSNATIASTTKIEADPNGKGMEMMGMKMKYNLNGDQTGTLNVELATGMITGATINQKMKGNMEMSGGMLPSAMNVPMNMESTVTIKVSKL